jgi:hypothetical protein
MYGLECNGRYNSYRIAHDDDYAVYRPGFVARKKVLEDCFARNIEAMDFMPGDDQHKRQWTDRFDLVDCVEFAKGMAASAILLQRRVAHGLRMRLKSFPALMRFKRNGVGVIRYILSCAPLIAFLGRAARALRLQGLAGLPWALCGFPLLPLGAKGSRVFFIRPNHSPNPAGGLYALRTLKLDEAVQAAGMTGMDKPKVAEAYFKGSLCQALLRDGSMAGYAWITESELNKKGSTLWKPGKPGDRCVYGIRLFGKRSGGDFREALQCLAGQPLPKACHSLALLLRSGDRKLTRCAQALFTPKMPEHLHAEPQDDESACILTQAGRKQNA